jgi:hypothetical protein
MIDPAVFRRFQPNSTINIPVYSTLEERDNLGDGQYLICTPVVLGFCFGTKMWGKSSHFNLSYPRYLTGIFS